MQLGGTLLYREEGEGSGSNGSARGLLRRVTCSVFLERGRRVGHEVFLWVHYQFDIILFSARRKQDLGKTGSQTYVRGPFVPLPLPLGQAGPHGTRATVGWQAGKEARRGLGDNCAPVVGKEHVQAGGGPNFCRNPS